VSDTHFDLTRKALQTLRVSSYSVGNEGDVTLEDVTIFRTYPPRVAQGSCTSHFDIPTKSLQMLLICSNSVSYEGQFSLEDVTVFRTYLPSYCSRVTDTSHSYLHTKGLQTLRICSNSVGNDLTISTNLA
jgi:hypothetical protein